MQGVIWHDVCAGREDLFVHGKSKNCYYSGPSTFFCSGCPWQAFWIFIRSVIVMYTTTLATTTRIIRTMVCRIRVLYWLPPPETSSKRAYKITDSVMALMLISDARVAVYILLRISGKSKSPVTLIPPNPTPMNSSKKMILSTNGELMMCSPFHTVKRLSSRQSRAPEELLMHPG